MLVCQRGILAQANCKNSSLPCIAVRVLHTYQDCRVMRSTSQLAEQLAASLRMQPTGEQPMSPQP
eukprot:3229757-Pleurochrysis_carterae.AAC.2